MNCRQAGPLLIDRELGRLTPVRYAALHRHLQGCPACRLEARDGRRLLEDLALLRGDVPFPIDTRARVMTRVAEIGRPGTDEPALRHYAIYAGVALLAGAVILGSLWDLLPGLVEPARHALSLLAAARGVVASLAAPLVGLLAIPLKLLGSLLESVWSMAPLLNRLTPLVFAAAAVALGTMSSTVVYFVGRDLRSRSLREET